jgi:hypothetical protein
MKKKGMGKALNGVFALLTIFVHFGTVVMSG